MLRRRDGRSRTCLAGGADHPAARYDVCLTVSVDDAAPARIWLEAVPDQLIWSTSKLFSAVWPSLTQGIFQELDPGDVRRSIH